MTRITSCDHQPKLVVGGTRLNICRECRNENIRTFYASGPLLIEAKKEPKPRKRTYIYRDLHAPSKMPEHEDGWVGE